MTGHTPGPWRVDSTVSLGAYGVWTAYSTHPGYDGAGYESPICSMNPAEQLIPREQRDANARLIAAAPELLEALKEQVRGAEWRQENEPDNWNGADDEALERARAAIEAAEGKDGAG